MSDITVDKGTFLKQVDFSMGQSINSATTIDLGATDGNTIVVMGTTDIEGLGTAPQAGITRTLIFADAVTIVYGVNLLTFGEADITTDANDIAEFLAITTTQWKMIGYWKTQGYTDGKLNSVGIKDKAITSAKLNDACVTNSKLKIKEAVNLVDTAIVLTGANIINKGIFTAVPTANRIQTTDTAIAIIAAIPGAQIGTPFEFTIINAAAFNETLAAGSDVTLVGNMVVNNGSATFIGIVTSPAEVTIYRK